MGRNYLEQAILGERGVGWGLEVGFGSFLRCVKSKEVLERQSSQDPALGVEKHGSIL